MLGESAEKLGANFVTRLEVANVQQKLREGFAKPFLGPGQQEIERDVGDTIQYLQSAGYRTERMVDLPTQQTVGLIFANACGLEVSCALPTDLGSFTHRSFRHYTNMVVLPSVIQLTKPTTRIGS